MATIAVVCCYLGWCTNKYAVPPLHIMGATGSLVAAFRNYFKMMSPHHEARDFVGVARNKMAFRKRPARVCAIRHEATRRETAASFPR